MRLSRTLSNVRAVLATTATMFVLTGCGHDLGSALTFDPDGFTFVKRDELRDLTGLGARALFSEDKSWLTDGISANTAKKIGDHQLGLLFPESSNRVVMLTSLAHSLIGCIDCVEPLFEVSGWAHIASVDDEKLVLTLISGKGVYRVGARERVTTRDNFWDRTLFDLKELQGWLMEPDAFKEPNLELSFGYAAGFGLFQAPMIFKQRRALPPPSGGCSYFNAWTGGAIEDD